MKRISRTSVSESEKCAIFLFVRHMRWCPRKLPEKIFTVHDEPPTWDENDDAGLESVSEPEIDDVIDNIAEFSMTDDATEADITLETVIIPSHSPMTQNAVDDEGWGSKPERSATPSNQPIVVDKSSSELRRDRPIIVERMRTESWVQTGREEWEAPNGSNVL